MASKLTLSINEKTIERAKLISRKRGTSISKMVEEFLESINEKEEKKESPIDRMHQIMKGNITDPLVDWKKAKEEHIAKKYGL